MQVTDNGRRIYGDYWFEFDGPYGGRQAALAIEEGHLAAEVARGWGIGERKQLAGTVFAVRVA